MPVASWEARDDVARLADEVVCPIVSRDFGGVGQFYGNFTQTRDAEVGDFLSEGDRVTGNLHRGPGTGGTGGTGGQAA